MYNLGDYLQDPWSIFSHFVYNFRLLKPKLKLTGYNNKDKNKIKMSYNMLNL